MSQDDVLRMLEEKKEPLSSKELSIYLNIRQETIIKTLRKLLKQKAIKSKHPTEKEMRSKGYKGHNMNGKWRLFSAK